MDINAHYESYRANVMKDALPGWPEYCSKKPTKDPERYPTIQSYLTYTTTSIKNSVAAGDEVAYKKFLLNHRKTLLTVFDRMVSEYFAQFGELEHEMLQAALLNMIQNQGWNWFRFCPVAWIVDTGGMLWIPRYDRDVPLEKPAFDASEMKLILEVKPTKEKAAELVEAKRKTWLKVISSSLELIPVDTINKNTVQDWTQELFV